MIFFRITTGSLNSQDMISQVNIVLDIVWILYDVCLKVKIHGFVKLLYEFVR